MNLISRILVVVLLLVLSALGGITLGKLLKPSEPTVVPPIDVPADKGPSPEGKGRSAQEKRKHKQGRNKDDRDPSIVTSEPVAPAPPPPPTDDDDDDGGDDDDRGGGDD